MNTKMQIQSLHKSIDMLYKFITSHDKAFFEAGNVDISISTFEVDDDNNKTAIKNYNVELCMCDNSEYRIQQFMKKITNIQEFENIEIGGFDGE